VVAAVKVANVFFTAKEPGSEGTAGLAMVFDGVAMSLLRAVLLSALFAYSLQTFFLCQNFKSIGVRPVPFWLVCFGRR